VTEVWIAIAALTVISFTIKAVGPVALGGRELPPWADRLIALMPAALLSALVVVQTFAHGQELELDARAPGLAAAAIALALRASMLVVLLAAAATAAGLRALGWG
jgi:branched-subunit amino acid transport protein